MTDYTDNEPLRRVIKRESKENPDWLNRAYKAMNQLIRRGNDFTTDDFHQIMDGFRPNNPNSIGALFRAYSQEELITSVGYTQSKQKKRNGGGQRVWRPVVRQPEYEDITGEGQGE